jgi:hypothetical protein
MKDGDAELPGKLVRPAAHAFSDLLICLQAAASGPVTAGTTSRADTRAT